MINPCKYKERLKCPACKHAFHRECKLFMLAYAKDISRELQPFRFTSAFDIQDKAVWSRDRNKAKSAALRYALKNRSTIKKLSVSQVLALAIQNEVVDTNVIYIDYDTKLPGDPEKIKGVLTSFIENMLYKGACVAIYVAVSVVCNLEYPRV